MFNFGGSQAQKFPNSKDVIPSDVFIRLDAALTG